MSIAQLQLLTSYSLLASTNRVQELVQTGRDYGYQALAITDLNVMHGVVEFYQACLKQKIQPIIGLTIEYQEDTEARGTHRFVLLAKNHQGYRHLMQISTLKMERQTNQPLFLEEIAPYLGQLIGLTTGEHGQLEKLVLNGETSQAKKLLDQWRGWFDQGSFYGGIYLQGNQADTHQLWEEFASDVQLPLVALQDVRYLHPSDDFSVRILQHIENGTRLSLEQTEQTGPYYLPRAEEMTKKFVQNNLAQAVANIEKIVAQCQFELPLHQTLLPHYPVPEGQTAASYLQELCHARLGLRIPNFSEDYQERLDRELAVIHQMGFDDYFLIVWDVMDFAHRSKIVTGAGRGSAAGSLVSYVLSITDVDPVKYDLLFERFLNIERYSMPDIDLDIPDNRREEVLLYVNQKYGHHHVAQIATFGTMAAKMALRDVARVFGLSQSESNLWSNAIPNVLKITLEEAFKSSKKLQFIVNESDRNKLLYQTALKLEGLQRHVSTHAAGVVISDQELTELVPLQLGATEIPLTQFAMGEVEAVGLLKMDFLGLRNLSIMDDALKHIKRTENREIVLNQIPLDDQETLKLFQKGQTTGIFQFESSGIRNVLRRLGPTSIEDIAAVNALYRPGPMDNIDLFIKRKKGQVPIEYPDDTLRPILEVTYGIMVYQEQVMQVASKLAGFSLGEADVLRRAISKKKKSVLDEQRQNFIAGALKEGHSEEMASKVYDYIERFANYGFNRSHAFAYSFIGYQMAFLKVHYPTAFFAALLHSVRHNMTKIKEYISEARQFGVVIQAPDINKSDYSFFLSQDQIIFGFSALKGIRKDFIRNIIEERRANGYYASLENFLVRIESKWLKEENVLPLIYIGAFDQVAPNRKQLVMDLDGMIKNIQYSGGNIDLLEILSLKKEQVPDYTLEEKLEQEEQYIGTYLSGHPLEEYDQIKAAKQLRAVQELEVNQKANVLLYVKDIRTIRTKKGETMAFLEASDESGDISLTLFPRTYRQVSKILAVNTVYYVEGKVERSTYNQELQLLVETLILAKDFATRMSSKKYYLRVTKELDSPEVRQELKELLKNNLGNIPVILYYEKSDQKIALNDEFWLNDTEVAKNQLLLLLGEKNVILK